MTAASEPIAVIGVGTMGHGMAVSALRAGIPTVVWDRTPQATRELAELGADVAASAADSRRCRLVRGNRCEALETAAT